MKKHYRYSNLLKRTNKKRTSIIKLIDNHWKLVNLIIF
jgi:hypothetical protein